MSKPKWIKPKTKLPKLNNHESGINDSKKWLDGEDYWMSEDVLCKLTELEYEKAMEHSTVPNSLIGYLTSDNEDKSNPHWVIFSGNDVLSIEISGIVGWFRIP